MGFISLIIFILLIAVVVSWARGAGRPGASYRDFKLPKWIRVTLVVVGFMGIIAIGATSLDVVDRTLGTGSYAGGNDKEVTVKIPSGSVTTFLKSGEQLDLKHIMAIVTVYDYRNAIDARPDEVHQLILPATDLIGRHQDDPLNLGEGINAEFGLVISNPRIKVDNIVFTLQSQLKVNSGSSGRGGPFTIQEEVAAEALIAHGFGSHWGGSQLGAIPVVEPLTSLLSCIAFAHKSDPLKSVTAEESLSIYENSAVYREAWGEGTSAFSYDPSRLHRKGVASGIGLVNFLNPASGMLLVACCFFISMALPFHRVLAFCGVLILGIIFISWVDKTALEKATVVLEDAKLPATQRELAAAQMKNTFFWKETAVERLEAALSDESVDERIRWAVNSSIDIVNRNR